MNSAAFTDWIMAGGFLALVVFSIATYVRTGKIKEDIENTIREVYKQMEADKKDATASVGRVYQRLDEAKEKIEATYTKKDVCQVVHQVIADTLKDIVTKIDCIPKIKAGVDMLLKKYEASG